MRHTRIRSVTGGLLAVTILFGPLLVGVASADHGPGDDTNDDGVEDDFDHDGVADDLNGDCIPDDFNGDGIPDADNTDNSIYYQNCDPSLFEGEGGGLPESLSLQTITGILDPLYLFVPDLTGPDGVPDGFPDIPRLIDSVTGEDLGPDWSILDNVDGDPGERDLTQLPDNEINEFLLEQEDVNNTEFVDPITGQTEFVATPAALDHTITQINRARGDLGLVAGSGSTLRGPCMGQAWSYDDDGQPLDVAWDWDRAAPPVSFGDDGELQQAFSSEHPYKVHVDGAVIFTGIAGGLEPGTGPLDHNWFIRLEFLGFSGANIDDGGDPNPKGKNRNAGALSFFEDIPEPAKISGLVAVNGQMDAPETGTGQKGPDGDAVGNNVPFFCIASGFVEFQGGIPLTAPGVALVFLSTVGLLFNARPAKTWGGV